MAATTLPAVPRPGGCRAPPAPASAARRVRSSRPVPNAPASHRACPLQSGDHDGVIGCRLRAEQRRTPVEGGRLVAPSAGRERVGYGERSGPPRPQAGASRPCCSASLAADEQHVRRRARTLTGGSPRPRPRDRYSASRRDFTEALQYSWACVRPGEHADRAGGRGDHPEPVARDEPPRPVRPRSPRAGRAAPVLDALDVRQERVGRGVPVPEVGVDGFRDERVDGPRLPVRAPRDPRPSTVAPLLPRAGWT